MSMSPSSPAGAERRRFPRVQIFGELSGELVAPFQLTLNVIDISRGGFAVESPVPFTRDAEYAFQFVSQGRRQRTLTATNVHSVPAAGRAGNAAYIAGFSFAPRDERDVQLIDEINLEIAQERDRAR